jgi:hypothetical protein
MRLTTPKASELEAFFEKTKYGLKERLREMGFED